MTDTSEAPNATPVTGQPPSRADRQSPAAVVTAVFKTSAEVARVCGVQNSTAWRWLRSGLIPSEYHRPLLDEAVRRGLVLTADDLVNGRGNG